MSKTNTYTDDYSEAFKERLKILPFVIIIGAIAYWINKSLWTLDSILILSILVALIPTKLLLIIFRFFHLARTESKKFVFLLFLPIVLIIAFLFDFETIPNLWVYRFGKETQGNVVELFKTSRTHFIVYDFSVGNVSFQKQQKVSIPYYESLTPDAQVSIKYYKDNPRVSFLIDTQHLKFQTTLTIFIAFGIIFSLFASEIQEKIFSIFKNVFRAKRPA